MSFKDEYFRKQQELSNLSKELYVMKQSCPHEEKKVKLVETLGFEFTPRYVCSICQKELGSDIPKEEVKQCYREEWFDFIEEREIEESELEEFYQRNPRGFNLPRRKL